MIVISLIDCPPALRGDLTRWLLEISTGVYVGHVSARIREEIWSRICSNAKSGRATMVFSAKNEQRMDFRVHNSEREPIDFDGLKLVLHPSPSRIKQLGELRLGFSTASKIRKAKKMSSLNRKKTLFPKSYAVIDIETTGLSATSHEIIELSAIIVEDGAVTSRFHSLIEPGVCIPASITQLTGITNDMVSNEGRTLAQTLPEFLDFVGSLPVVSHNAAFDFGFLRAACKKHNQPLLSNRCIDTLALARSLIKNVENFKLETLLTHFGISYDVKHRSSSDCLSTQKLYEKLIEIDSSK